MRKSWQLGIRNILECIRRSQAYTAWMTEAEFAADQMGRSATEYMLIKIGAASRALPRRVRGRNPHVPWEDLIELGNSTIQLYYVEDAESLWRAITDRLPPLVPLLEAMLDEAP